MSGGTSPREKRAEGENDADPDSFCPQRWLACSSGYRSVFVYKSNRVERLLPRLTALLKTPSGDPFAPEVVVVHSKGMERWLAMQIGQSLGICANMRFPFPGRIVQEAFEAALGDRAERIDDWRPESLVWTIQKVLPPLLEDPDFAPISGYLDEDPKGLKRFQLAQRIARAFDKYATYRPDTVLKWERGLDGDETWQPKLWRALADVIDGGHIARLWRPFQDTMARRETPLSGMPKRLLLFGVSTLPPLYMDVLSRLARQIEVHLFQLAPSQEWWAHVRTKKQKERIQDGLFGSREMVDLHLEVGHPLLASLGRLGRDFQLVLEDCDYHEPDESLFDEPIRDDLLGGLQRDILHLDVEPRPARSDDRSVQVHSCHGELRQVQVLQDQLLQLFKEMPGLQPRDVAVLMPDVEQWAPLVKAVFDRERDDVRHIPFRVSDRSLRRDNPVAEALIALLGLVDARVTASQVLDLLGHAPIRERFAISAEDVEPIGGWVRASGIRWGVDEHHRARFGVPPIRQNTWRFGLDRLVLGTAMRGEDEVLFGGVLPYDEIEGGETRLLGRFVALCEALFSTLEELRQPRSLAAWGAAVNGVLDELVDAEGDHAWQHQQVRAVLSDAVERADGVAFDAPLEIDVVQSFLGGVFEQSMPASGYLSGQVTFCAMVPMRSIPFRVVCMLGMDERAYPRRGRRLDFDLVDGAKHGDRTPREDDRTLFLEALLSARDRLIITYKGQDIRDNKPTPPSVMVSELLDALEESRGDVRDQIVVAHPLQPFSPRNFGSADDARLFSFDQDYLEGAVRLSARRDELPPFFEGPLPAVEPPTEVALDDLISFFERGPVVSLMNKRLRVRYGRDDDPIEDREPVELNGLELWALGAPLLDKAVANPDRALEDYRVAVRAKGSLPHGVPGDCVFQTKVTPVVEPLAAQIRSLLGGADLPLVRVDLDIDGVRVTGSVDRWTDKGRLLYHYSKLKAKHHLRAWIEHLASCAAMGFRNGTRLLGRRSGGGVAQYDFEAVRPEWAIERLEDLMQLYIEGQSHPLALFPESGLAWAEVLADGGWGASNYPAERAGKGKWSPNRWSGEGDDPHIRRALGEAEFSPELRVIPGDDLEELARRVFAPMLASREEAT